MSEQLPTCKCVLCGTLLVHPTAVCWWCEYDHSLEAAQSEEPDLGASRLGR